MEVMKIFSDIEGDERLYSVLMDEEEMYLFSEIQKEFTSVRLLKKGLQRVKKDVVNLQKTNPRMTISQAKNAMSSNQNFRNVRSSISKLESGNRAGTLSSSIQKGSRANKSISKKMNEIEEVSREFKRDPLPFKSNLAQSNLKTPISGKFSFNRI